MLQFFSERNYSFSSSLLEVSRAAMQINIAKDQQLLDKQWMADLEGRLLA